PAESLVPPDTSTTWLAGGTEVPASCPEDGYLGDYIVDIARALVDAHGPDVLAHETAFFKEAAEKAIFADIEATMRRLGIEMDTYFNELSLYETGAVWEVVEALKAKARGY